jgi:hypothetical protein
MAQIASILDPRLSDHARLDKTVGEVIVDSRKL